MKNRVISPYKILIITALVLLVVAIIMGATGNIDHAGPLIILFFVLLAIGFQGYRPLKGYSYSLTIFGAVASALYYPGYFEEINGFDLSNLIVPLIQIIMFGMGTSMSIGDFVSVVKSPKGVAIGVLSQTTIMPVLGFILANISHFPSEIAAGIILIGCSPSGLASNVMSYLAKANVALSITITSICTLLAPMLTPVLMKLLAGSFVEIDMWAMMWNIVKMVIFPIGLGLLFNKLFSKHSKWLDTIMPLLSMAGIAVIIMIITAAGRDSLLSIGFLLLCFVLIHNTFGYFLGYWAARLSGLNERDSRTISFEIGMQNGGLASGIAQEMGKIATLGLAAGVFGPLMNVTGSILASYWQRNSPSEKRTDNALRS